MSVPAYLELERSSPDRHEYIDGEVFAMGGASHAHNRIVSNLVFELRRALGDGRCYPLSSDMRVRVAESRYVYPDVVVVCGEAELEDGDTLLNPTLVIEVLSESTEAYDRGAKFAHYRGLATLREYVLVSQHERRIEQYVREADGPWRLSEFLAGRLELPSLGAGVAIDAVYLGTRLG
jgi:Uma2 family endonuclease